MRQVSNNSGGSWVIWLIFINVIVYLLQGIFMYKQVNYLIPYGGEAVPNQSSVMTFYLGLIPALVVNKGYVWQVFTYMFLHGGFLHIFLNMYALMLFGSPVEQLWGGKKFLFYYIFTGVGAGFVILIINVVAGGTGPFIPTIGASGAVFGLLLAFGLLFPEVELLIFFFFPMKAKYLVILYGGIEFYALISTGGNSGVSHVGHLGGLFFGIIYFIIMRKRGIEFKTKKVKAMLNKEVRKRDVELSPQGRDREYRLIKILEKVKEGGSASITDDEYQFISHLMIMNEDDVGCVEEDFNYQDDYCRKCDNFESCIIRELKKYL